MDKHNKESERQKLKLAAATTSGAVSNEFLDESERLTPHATGNAEPVAQPQLAAINAADKCCNWVQSGDDPITHDERMTCAKFIQSAINAALADERQRNQNQADVLKRLGDMLGVKLDNNTPTSELFHAVTAERQRIMEQLLSALAAIEKHSNKTYPTISDWNVRVDLSALREHDAEVRKPLVEALEEIVQCGYKDADTLRMIARDRIDALALAKVKEWE